MMTDLVFQLFCTFILLAVNTFFVLAEFAFVRARRTKIQELADTGNSNASIVQNIQNNMDNYLGVVQIGVTGATLGLGVVLDNGLVHTVTETMALHGRWAEILGIVVSYTVAIGLTVVISELVPKAIAFRHAEFFALLFARPMRFFYYLFYPIHLILTVSARFFLRRFGLDLEADESPANENELRIILSESQEGGVMPFRRLLLFENVFDFAQLQVKDAMRDRSKVATLEVSTDRDGVLAAVRQARFSRFPVVFPGADPSLPPIGIVHIKSLFFFDRSLPFDMAKLIRPAPVLSAEMPLEKALATFQRSRNHLAVVTDADGHWVGVLSFEDVIEEIIGKIEDEFEVDEPFWIEQMFSPESVALDLSAKSIEDVLANLGDHLRFPLPMNLNMTGISKSMVERERLMTSYVGNGVAIPHLRLDGLSGPLIGFVRLKEGVSVPGRSGEVAKMLFIILSPQGAARVHLRLLSRLAQLIESDYVLDRLAEVTSHWDVVQTVGDGDRMLTG
jgi:CBS domain containing-hemolysin-like protein